MKWGGKQTCHLAIMCVAKIWSMDLTARPHLGSRIRMGGAMFILPTYAFTASSLKIFSFSSFTKKVMGPVTSVLYC